ncbi:MAG: TM1802 family CRISPR-associated protein [Aminivibrio sp.]|jgi:CRISPR-associated protein Csh1
MGFLEAVKALGKMQAEAMAERNFGKDGDFLSDISNYLEQPTGQGGKPPEQIIRVWCRAENLETCLADESIPLRIRDVDKIDCIEYGAGGDSFDPEIIKRKLLYRAPPGSNVTWSFSPIYKLGRGKTSADGAVADLIGTSGDWSSDSNTRFYKLRNRVLQAYSTGGVWSPDACTLVLEALEKNVTKLAELWSEAKTSTILLFGLVSSAGEFLWPGEIPQYRRFFRSKLQPIVPGDFSKKSKRTASWRCSSCLSEKDGGEQSLNSDEVFSFATFDKPGFLPGIKTGREAISARRKVWPICWTCGGLLSRGRDYLEQHYLKDNIMPGMNLFVVPELVMSGRLLSKAADLSRDFLRKGVKTEERLFNYLAKQEDSLVFHFVFWEKNQAQELIHLMLEDVPPSRLKKLESKWKETVYAFPFSKNRQIAEGRTTIDYAFKSIYRFFLYGAKNDGEKKWLRSRALGVWGKLLEGSGVDVAEVKNLAVARLPSCFSDKTWLQYSGPNMFGAARIIDFLARINGR